MTCRCMLLAKMSSLQEYKKVNYTNYTSDFVDLFSSALFEKQSL